MAGVADGGAEGDGTEGSGGDQGGGSVLAENGAGLGRPDFTGFVADDAVKALSEAGGEGGEAAEIAGAGEVGVGAAILVKGCLLYTSRCV